MACCAAKQQAGLLCGYHTDVCNRCLAGSSCLSALKFCLSSMILQSRWRCRTGGNWWRCCAPPMRLLRRTETGRRAHAAAMRLPAPTTSVRGLESMSRAGHSRSVLAVQQYVVQQRRPAEMLCGLSFLVCFQLLLDACPDACMCLENLYRPFAAKSFAILVFWPTSTMAHAELWHSRATVTPTQATSGWQCCEREARWSVLPHCASAAPDLQRCPLLPPKRVRYLRHSEHRRRVLSAAVSVHCNSVKHSSNGAVSLPMCCQNHVAVSASAASCMHKGQQKGFRRHQWARSKCHTRASCRAGAVTEGSASLLAGYRREGHCRRLMHAIEGMLHHMQVHPS